MYHHSVQHATAKEELVNSDMATKEQVAELKKLCKTLLAKDEKHEEFVQTIVTKTDAFKSVKAGACKTLIESINEILKEYE